MNLDNTNDKLTVEFDLNDFSILVVDDIEDARLFLSAYLKRRGVTVYSAINGQQGLELFKQHHPDIIITDISMAHMDGLSMAEAIREIDVETPIIFVTAYSEVEPMHRSIGVGATEYLVKPITHHKLQQALHKAVNKLKTQRNLHATIDNLQNEKEHLSKAVSHLIGEDQHVSVEVLRRGQDIISGDFHCVVQHQHSLYVLLGDGMGHGLSAILPALNLPKQFRILAGQGHSLLRIADELNGLLATHGIPNHFVAATLIRIDAEQNLIEVINCGNPDALLIDDHGKLLHHFPSNYVAWGILSDDEFLPGVQSYRYQTQAKLYVYSDGFTETLKKNQNTPTTETFSNILSSHPNNTLNYLDDWLNALVPDQTADDITLLEITTPSITDQSIKKQESFKAKLSGKPRSINSLSILLVEDNSDALDSLGQFLSRKTGKVYQANNTGEGLQLFVKHRPSLIVVDINKPLINGVELVKQVRDIDSDVPIIMTGGYETGQSSTHNLGSLLELAVNKFLTKPLDKAQLLEAIQFCFDKFHYVNNLHVSASLFMTSPLAMTITDANRNITAVNPAFTAITGYSETDVLGCNPRIFSSGKHNSAFYKHMWDCIKTRGQWSGEIWNRRKNGELFLEWINITAIYDDEGNISHYASIFSDITQRVKAEEKIRHLAHHDPLTTLPNRTLFFDRLGQALLKMQREQGKLAVIYLDVDHFKNINDTLGHSTGDELICVVAQALRSTLRQSDTVCRLGGDEFAILLPDIENTENIAHLAGKIFHAASKTYQIADKELRIGISMGISQYPRDGTDAETLIKRADIAMYQAKKKGRNRFQFFNYGLEQEAERQMVIQHSFHKSLENNEFYIHYQPKYALDEQRIIGAEALLRWKHTDLGELSPAEFIPIAEETGFIIELGDWLIEKVCQDIANWKALGASVVTVAINVSPFQFHRGNLQQTLQENLSRYHLAPSLLQIELTEGVVMNTQTSTLKRLQAIKDMGITISIDDFGTGYSSLSYLRKLPIDELKIDRSFIMEIVDQASLMDSRLTAIPSTIIELAQKLKLKLVAEGVETNTQRDFLQQNGCQIIQGYLFSKPINKDQMFELLND